MYNQFQIVDTSIWFLFSFFNQGSKLYSEISYKM